MTTHQRCCILVATLKIVYIVELQTGRRTSRVPVKRFERYAACGMAERTGVRFQAYASGSNYDLPHHDV